MSVANKCRVLVGVALCFALSSFALGAPSVTGVSGALSSTQTVTITGSGFGSKPQAQPVLWDDFESGVNGQLIANSPARIGRWDSGAGSENVTYSSAKSHGGSKAAFNDFISGQNASLAKNMTFSRVYMDFWIITSYVDRISRNWKPWRFYGDNDSLQLDFVWLCDSQLMNRVQDSVGWAKGDWGGSPYANNTWMHVQLVYAESSAGVANGTIRHYIDSKVYGNDSGAIITQMAPAHFDQIRIGHYWAKDAIDACTTNSGARVYVDDVYVDTSWARVELGNAPTYAASTHREVQVPTAWSDGSISVKFNSGTFAAGSTAYLFVTDANNNTSPGISVKIGGTSTSLQPNPPTDVNAR